MIAFETLNALAPRSRHANPILFLVWISGRCRFRKRLFRPPSSRVMKAGNMDLGYLGRTALRRLTNKILSCLVNHALRSLLLTYAPRSPNVSRVFNTGLLIMGLHFSSKIKKDFEVEAWVLIFFADCHSARAVPLRLDDLGNEFPIRQILTNNLEDTRRDHFEILLSIEWLFRRFLP